MKKMHGIIAVTVTLFKDNGEIDYANAEKHIEQLIASGVHGLLPLGATGEFAALSMQERKEYAEFVMKLVDGRVPVMIGAVSMNTEDTIEICDHAKSINADAVMILPSPGLHPSQDEIYAYYKEISEKISIPVMLYNNPGSCGVDIEPETLAKLVKLPHMEYLKESTGDIMRLTRAIDAHEDQITTFCGCESLAFESFVMGAKGWICVFANMAPKMSVELFNLVTEKKDLESARKLYRKMLPVLRITEETGQLWQVVKYVMSKQGFGTGALRSPRLPISDDVKKAVDAVLANTQLS